MIDPTQQLAEGEELFLHGASGSASNRRKTEAVVSPTSDQAKAPCLPDKPDFARANAFLLNFGIAKLSTT